MNIFKAYDIRGVYGTDITDEIALDIGKSMGTLLRGRRKVCVGYDTRPSSVALFNNFISGLTSTGCSVVSLGMVTNPMVYFHARNNKIFGCYVTASHNPVNWNGFKLIKPNGTSFLTENKPMVKIFYSKKFLRGSGDVEKFNAVKEYTDFLKRKFEGVEGDIVTDFLGGAGLKNKEVLRNIGINITPLHEKPDASLYGFHMLEPWGELLNDTKKAVRKKNANFGVAYDCDADRSIFIDSEGEYIDPSMIIGIFIKSMLKGGDKVVVTFDCASELEKLVKSMGGKLLFDRIGHTFLENRVVKEKALLAGEESSHYHFNKLYPFSDGLLSTLQLCRALNETGKNLGELVKGIRFNHVEKIYIDAGTDEKKSDVVERLRKRYPNSTDIMDGFKVFLGEEWFIIRGSQTLPEINLCVEARNKKRERELVDKYTDMIKKEL